MLQQKQLPIYIQKYIIKILCNFINQNFKSIDPIKVFIDYRDNEREVFNLLWSLVLVNHTFLKTIQQNINVSIDFNFYNDIMKPIEHNETSSVTVAPTTNKELMEQQKQQEREEEESLLEIYKKNCENDYSIIKIDNIKILKLHYDSEQPCYYKLINVGSSDGKVPHVEIEIKLDTVNRFLKLLSKNGSLKKLIIRNVNALSNFNLIPLLYDCEATNNIQLLEYEINSTTTLDSLKLLSEKVKKIFQLKINNCYSPLVILEAFKLYHKSIYQIIIVSQSSPPESTFSIYKLISGTLPPVEVLLEQNSDLNISQFPIDRNELTFNYFESLKSLKFYSIESTFQDYECLLNSISKSDENISITLTICFDKLIYFLSTPQERIDLDLSKCDCSSLMLSREESSGNNSDHLQQQQLDEEIFEFETGWSNITKLFSKSKVLKSLEICHECSGSGQTLKWPNSDPFPQSFKEKFGSLISNIVSLDKILIMGAVDPTLFYEIIKHSKTITRFESSLLEDSCDSIEDYKSSIDDLLNLNQHIQEFRFSVYKLAQNEKTNLWSYNEHFLIDYNNFK